MGGTSHKSLERQPSTDLVYVSDLDPGIRRKPNRSGFRFVGPDGCDPRAHIERIEQLAIPPAWTSVWICPDANGHIQATGRDAKGRKQYIYHPQWRSVRDANKFERVIAFGRALPRLRRQVERDLALPGLPRAKVLAAVVRLMELTLIRVGNAAYAKQNRTFGLTTLRDRHVKVSGTTARFEFRGKSGKVHRTGFKDRRLARIVKSCQEIPGQQLFQYLDADGRRCSVGSADANEYIRSAMGASFSAKDFRTWAATVAAAEFLTDARAAQGTGSARLLNDCVKEVAGLLGNTVAVCRKAYIHPQVLEAGRRGGLPLRPTTSRRRFELAVIQFLEGAVETRPADPRGSDKEIGSPRHGRSRGCDQGSDGSVVAA